MDENVKFNDLLFKALDHAIHSVSTGETLVPFVMTESSVIRFAADTLEKGKEEAEKYTQDHLDENYIVLSYDGYLTVEGEKTDAVFVQGTNRERKEVITLAQRYGLDGGFHTIGNPVMVSKK